MLSHLKELEIVPYRVKSSINTALDLVVLLPEPDGPILSELFNKLFNSLKLIKPDLNYDFFYIDDGQQLVDKLQGHSFHNLLVFKDILNLEYSELYRVYNLNRENVLVVDNLKIINSNQEIKKKLWQDLKKLLA